MIRPDKYYIVDVDAGIYFLQPYDSEEDAFDAMERQGIDLDSFDNPFLDWSGARIMQKPDMVAYEGEIAAYRTIFGL